MNADYGAVHFFKDRPIAKIETRDFNAFMNWVKRRRSDLSPGTLNHIAIAFRKVMSVAYTEGAIESVPDTPRQKNKDNPRSFFRFHPLVSKERDEYKQLLAKAKQFAKDRIVVRGTVVTEELYDFILFMTHSSDQQKAKSMP